MLLSDLIDLYAAHYAGRDTSRMQRVLWWQRQVGAIALQDLSDDHVHAALEALKQHRSRYFAGKDADGQPIYKAKKEHLAPATINRYAATLAAIVTWAIKRRIAPKGMVHPCRSIEREAENNEKTRFLTDDERTRLLGACRLATWPRLYLLVLMALTTGARKGELLGLRWADVDMERAEARVALTKNRDPQVLPWCLLCWPSSPGSRPGRPCWCSVRRATARAPSRSRPSLRRLSRPRGFGASRSTRCGTPAHPCWRPTAPRCWKSPTSWATDSCR